MSIAAMIQLTSSTACNGQEAPFEGTQHAGECIFLVICLSLWEYVGVSIGVLVCVRARVRACVRGVCVRVGG